MAAAEVIAKATPFSAKVVHKWLVQTGHVSPHAAQPLHLQDFAEQDLLRFLFIGLQATRAAVESALMKLVVREGLPVEGDALGFVDPRVHAAVRLAFGRPFSRAEFENPASPFFRVGHIHKDYSGWWRCPCWKCN